MVDNCWNAKTLNTSSRLWPRSKCLAGLEQVDAKQKAAGFSQVLFRVVLLGYEIVPRSDGRDFSQMRSKNVIGHSQS